MCEKKKEEKKREKVTAGAEFYTPPQTKVQPSRNRGEELERQSKNGGCFDAGSLSLSWLSVARSGRGQSQAVQGSQREGGNQKLARLFVRGSQRGEGAPWVLLGEISK